MSTKVLVILIVVGMFVGLGAIGMVGQALFPNLGAGAQPVAASTPTPKPTPDFSTCDSATEAASQDPACKLASGIVLGTTSGIVAKAIEGHEDQLVNDCHRTMERVKAVCDAERRAARKAKGKR